MKREILFRGKRIDNGEWVYGKGLQQCKDELGNEIVAIFEDIVKSEKYIKKEGRYTLYYVPVKAETLGQYTGLKDKNGIKIFEGDILKTPRGFIGQVVFGRAEEECRHKVFGRMVIDCYTTYGWIFVRGDGYRCAIDDELLEGEIIGNIHDNPELMKGGSNEA